jgi:hypothetical protein
MYNINKNKDADMVTTITVPVSNACCDEFKIWHDSYEEPIDLLCDWAQKHDEKINRVTHIAFTLSDEEITEYEDDGCIEDYTCGGNEGVYLSFVIMRDYVTTERLKY